jgi:hypothetical protein
LTCIDGYAFEGCSSLKQVALPASLIQIEDCAFRECTSLTEIHIPSSLISLAKDLFSGENDLPRVFYSHNNISKITVVNGHPLFDSRNDCNAVIETATNTLLLGCKNTIIPEGITAIGKNAFREVCGLSIIEIPESVTEIGDLAFFGCKDLTEIHIPASVNKSAGMLLRIVQT